MLEIFLLVGKVVFLVVLYVFIFSVVRSSTRELRLATAVTGKRQWRMPGATAPGEEAPVHPGTKTAELERGAWALSVVKSPCIPASAAYVLPAETHALAGRSPDMDIYLEDTFVSAKHALFEVTADGLYVEDLRSTNGTQVNGRPISEPALLKVGDQVAVGDTIFRVEVR
jgi:hypothetical protein